MPGTTLTLAGVARYLGWSRQSLYNQLKDGRFPVRPIPNTRPRKWNIDDIDRWRCGEYDAD